MKIGVNSVPPQEGGVSAARESGSRAAALVIGALVLLAAFIMAAPYLSMVLKQGYSVLSGQTTTEGTPSGVEYNATVVAQCSKEVAIQALAPPDIANGSADVSYPSDYCTLAAYALVVINQDRAANGTGPVVLDYNQAAQQHADSMLYYGYFSHFDTQGLKPYMRYSLLGGDGANYENVAYSYYSIPHYLSTAAVEGAVQQLERSMVYNDSICCANGHKYNILDPLHNKVSIGIAYTSTHVYFDEEFENDYIGMNFTLTAANSSNPYYVTMTGYAVAGTPLPNSIYIGFDSLPAPETRTQLNNGPHEYGPGALEGGVLPPSGLFGSCGQFTSGTTVCADTWKFSSKGVDIAFSLLDFIKHYGPGVYTVYLITGSTTASALTSISVFVSG